MSQSSVAEQVKDFGLPVRQGIRMSTPPNQEIAKPSIDPAKFGSDLWFSRWTHNAFDNYPVVKNGRGIRFLADAAKGLPAFVVGVGPSLDDDIASLKKLTRQAVLISTDAAYRALRANGVVPDIVISYDCKREQGLLWSEMDPSLVHPPMMFSSCAHPEAIKSWPGPVLFYNQYHTQDELCKRILPDIFPELGQLPSGGTVGNVACFLAHCLGCNPICVVGMDFCYQQVGEAWRYRAQDWKWRCDLLPVGLEPHWEKTELKKLYDNDERMARSFLTDQGEVGRRTDHELDHYLNIFCDLMPHFEVPIVNCTPKGMLPGSFKAMTVSEARDKFCKETWQEGRTVLHHIASIIKDPRP